MRFCVETFHSASYPLTEITNATKREYCERHGYAFELTTDAPANDDLAWARLRNVRRLLDSYDYVLHMDGDTLITDMTRTIVPHVYDVVVTADRNGLNSGVFMARNTPEAKCYLDTVLDVGKVLYHTHTYREQKAMEHFAYVEPHRQFVRFVPQKQLQTYPDAYGRIDPPAALWAPGDWIAHVPALPDAKREAIYRDMIAKTVR